MKAICNSLRYDHFATKEDIAAKEKTVIVVARFDEDTKRLSLVLRAWREIEQDARLNEWKLQLVGDGRDMPFYRYLVETWHLKRVEFTGQQNPLEYYLKASLFLMTSTAEGWPLVLSEAMQMGVPVLAMDSFGSLHDLVTDGHNGRIVPNNELRAFVEAMRELMTDEETRKAMSLQAVAGTHAFQMKQVAAKWLALFNEIQSA